MNKSLLVLLLVAGTRAAMAGTRATALRRPRPSHRHYHEAPGYLGAQPKLGPTLQEALSAARQYKKQNVKKAAQQARKKKKGGGLLGGLFNLAALGAVGVGGLALLDGPAEA